MAMELNLKAVENMYHNCVIEAEMLRKKYESKGWGYTPRKKQSYDALIAQATVLQPIVQKSPMYWEKNIDGITLGKGVFGEVTEDGGGLYEDGTIHITMDTCRPVIISAEDRFRKGIELKVCDGCDFFRIVVMSCDNKDFCEECALKEVGA